MSLLERLASISRVSVVDESSSYEHCQDGPLPDATETGTILFDQRMVDLMHSRRLHDCVSMPVRQSWVRYPCPPVGFDATDIVVLLLCSQGYTFNSISFPWQNSVELTFQRLWRMAERLCRMSCHSEVLHPLISDRNAYGYSLSRGIEVYSPESVDLCLDSTHQEMMEELQASLEDEGRGRPMALGRPYCVQGLVSVIALTMESFFV